MSYKAVENFGVNIPLDYGEEKSFEWKTSRVRSRRLLSRLDRSGSRPDRVRPVKKVDRSVSTGY